MSEMLDRAAAAMFEGANGSVWKYASDFHKEYWRKLARLGVGAIREPSEEMIKAASQDESAQDRTPEAHWREMIGVVLK